jgi:hypothetical protein
MAGTRNCTVARCVAMASRKAGGSKDGTITLVAPTYTKGRLCTPSPPMWKRGAAVTVTSPWWTPRPWVSPLRALATALAWVSTAPLGRPVVPEVYMMPWGWDGSTSMSSGSVVAAAMRCS